MAFGWKVYGSGGAGEGMKLWVLDFGGVSDKERDGEVEATSGGEALHNDIVRQRDREWESERVLMREKIRKKWIFF